MPPASSCCSVDRHVDFVLAAGADAMFVDDLVGHGLGARRRDAGRQHGFVLRKRLLGEEGAREVQVAARPRRVLAERPEVLDGALDLLRRATRRRTPACGGRVARIGPPRWTTATQSASGSTVLVAQSVKSGTLVPVRERQLESDDAAAAIPCRRDCDRSRTPPKDLLAGRAPPAAPRAMSAA